MGNIITNNSNSCRRSQKVMHNGARFLLLKAKSPQVENLQALEYTTLIDMLADHTLNLTRVIAEGGSDEEYSRIILSIKALQAEIEDRKRTSNNTSTTDPSIVFPDQ